jgi:hypothetical protein
LNDSFRQIAGGAFHERLDLRGKRYQIPRYRRAQQRVSQECQCHKRYPR